MNSISIHDTKVNQISETFQDTSVERCLRLVSQSSLRDINTDLYSAGWFDGLMGSSPKLPHLKDYWDGYALGYREYCCGLLGLEIPASEIPVERLSALMAV